MIMSAEDVVGGPALKIAKTKSRGATKLGNETVGSRRASSS